MVNRVQKMEVGRDWTASFLMKAGTPAMPIPISDWTLQGKAWVSQLPTTYVTLSLQDITGPPAIPHKLEIVDYTIQESDLEIDRFLPVGQQVELLTISLQEADTTLLGEAVIEVEIVRTSPEPTRPILRFKIANNQGVTL